MDAVEKQIPQDRWHRLARATCHTCRWKDQLESTDSTGSSSSPGTAKAMAFMGLRNILT